MKSREHSLIKEAITPGQHSRRDAIGKPDARKEIHEELCCFGLGSVFDTGLWMSGWLDE